MSNNSTVSTLKNALHEVPWTCAKIQFPPRKLNLNGPCNRAKTGSPVIKIAEGGGNNGMHAPTKRVTTNNTHMTTDSDSDTTQKGDLVVVGSSAGGIGALSTLVSTLNKNFPAPIVLAQHLDPQRPSHLGTILERRSTLPIVVVSEDPPTQLETGKIYVVPANRHVR